MTNSTIDEKFINEYEEYRDDSSLYFDCFSEEDCQIFKKSWSFTSIYDDFMTFIYQYDNILIEFKDKQQEYYTKFKNLVYN